MKKRIVLQKVFEGIYRTPDGGVRVFHRPWKDKDKPWVMQWQDFMSVRHQLSFETLNQARNHLNKGSY